MDLGRNDPEPNICAIIVIVVVLLFYVHDKHLRSCRDGQLTKQHFSWAGLDLLRLKAVNQYFVHDRNVDVLIYS